MSPELPDREDRTQAVFTRENAIVWASAGTGKTHTLILRALQLLLELGGSGLFTGSRQDRQAAASRSVRSLLLITFTRKAAAEMQNRLCRYLDLVLQTPEEDIEHRYRDPLFIELVEHWSRKSGGWSRFRAGIEALAESLTELQISTIHSYAAGLLRRYPLEARLPVDCPMAREDEDDVSDFGERLVQAWWQGVGFRSPAAAGRLAAMLEAVAFGDIQACLESVLRAPWIVDRLPGLVAVQPVPAPAVRSGLGALAARLQSLSGSKQLRVGNELAGLLAGEPDWPRLLGFLSEHEKYLSPKSCGPGIRKAIEGLDPPVREILNDWPALRASVQAKALAALGPAWTAWQELAGEFRVWSEGAGVRELGMVSFDDLLLRARRLLERHPRVRAEERGRLRAVLVDEFQDTDPVQLELIRMLLAAGDDRPPALGFLVGDPKQSIYRFRGADVTSVEAFCRRYSDSHAGAARDFHLKSTFRCSPAITRFVNRMFDACLPLATDEPSKLAPAESRDGPVPDWVLLEPPGGGSLKAHQVRELVARSVAATVQDLVAGGDGPARAYREILVLARNYRDLDPILRHLQAAGIPAVSSGSRTFLRQPEVLDVISLLICLHNPLDEVAMASVLRSPLAGLDDPELARLLRETGLRRLLDDIELPPWLPEPARGLILELRRLRTQRMQLHPEEWLSRVRRLIPRHLYVRPEDCEGRALARIDKVLRAFGRELLGGEVSPLTWLLRQRQRSAGADNWDAELGEDVALTDESVDAVRVLTVHKAKGLESPVVIVCSWPDLIGEGRPPRGPGPVVELTEEDGHLREFRLPFGEIMVESPGYAGAAEEDRKQDREETCRLAYVAATRARDRLILLYPLGRDKSEGERLASLGAALGDTVRFVRRSGVGLERARPVGVESGADPELYRQCWQRRSAASGGPVPLLHHPSAGDEPEEWEDEPPRTVSAGGDQVTGLLVHRYLERWVHRPEFDPGRLAELAPATEAEEAQARAARILERFFRGEARDDAGRQLLQRVGSAVILARELPVLLEFEERLWHGVVDLVLEEEGVVRGVDYKTGGRQSELPAAYERQERLYREALTRLFPGRAVEFEFWWLG